MQPIKAIIFDLGDTLLNYGAVDIDVLFTEGARLTYAYLQKILPDQKLPHFAIYRRRNIRAIKLHYFLSEIVQRDFNCLDILGRLARKMGLVLTPEQLDELAWLWYEPLGQSAQIEPDLPETLARLRDQSLQLAIISNTFLPSGVLDRHLRQFGICDFFSPRIYTAETIVRKPDPRVFYLALEQLQVPPEQVVMVGDKVRPDIRGGRRAGMRPVFKRNELNGHKKVPSNVPIIENISELPDLIERMGKGPRAEG